MKPNQRLLLLLAVLCAVSLPYIIAAGLEGKAHDFGGFLLNPLDGNTYLAKMYLGWSGEWKFTLPYTAERGEGAYLFLFYLFLGHLARWLSLPLLVVFHFARAASAALLLFTLVEFCEEVFADRPAWIVPAAWLSAVGSGMGWLVLLTGQLPSDFWVAETYPFLSMYSNPHFPLGLAILIKILVLSLRIKNYAGDRQPLITSFLLLAILGLLESIILPFGVVVLWVIQAGWFLLEWLDARGHFWLGAGQRIVLILVCVFGLGAPSIFYQYWATLRDPLLAGWNAQNLTLSPPLWDFILSLSPGLPLAVFGAWKVARVRQFSAQRMLLAWFLLGIALVYLPFPLQRRFMLGLYLPVAALAIFGVQWLVEQTRRSWALPLIFGLALPTNLLVLVIGLFGTVVQSPELYMSRDESLALAWIEHQTPRGAVVLASPEISKWIPAHTGRRVIYGHPFETVNAAAEEQNVLAIYTAQWSDVQVEAFLLDRGVRYIWNGTREQSLFDTDSGLGYRANFSRFPVVYRQGTVTIYAVEGAQ